MMDLLHLIPPGDVYLSLCAKRNGAWKRELLRGFSDRKSVRSGDRLFETRVFLFLSILTIINDLISSILNGSVYFYSSMLCITL